jgi:hypothetical protein
MSATIDQRLIAASPNRESINREFVEGVMHRISRTDDTVIISSVFRNTHEQQSRKGGLFMRKIQALPVAVVIVGSLLALTLLGGITYAAISYFWNKPTVNVGEFQKTSDGRSQAVVALKNCQETRSGDEFIAEYSKKRSISKQDVTKYTTAQCELAMLESYEQVLQSKVADNNTHIQVEAPSMIPTQVLARGDSITSRTGLVISIDATTQFVNKEGMNVERRAIDGATPIAIFVEREDTRGTVRAHTIAALSEDLKYYQQYGQEFYVRKSCEGNLASETCLGGKGELSLNWLPVYEGGYGVGNPDAPQIKESDTYAQYEGVITAIDEKANKVDVLTSSGRAITLQLPFHDEVLAANSTLPEALKVSDTIQFRARRDDTAKVFTQDTVLGVIVIFEPSNPPETSMKKY